MEEVIRPWFIEALGTDFGIVNSTDPMSWGRYLFYKTASEIFSHHLIFFARFEIVLLKYLNEKWTPPVFSQETSLGHADSQFFQRFSNDPAIYMCYLHNHIDQPVIVVLVGLSLCRPVEGWTLWTTRIIWDYLKKSVARVSEFAGWMMTHELTYSPLFSCFTSVRSCHRWSVVHERKVPTLTRRRSGDCFLNSRKL